MSENGIAGVPLSKLTKAYIKIRDSRAALKREFDDTNKDLLAKQDKIKAALLQYCKDEGVESVRTDEGLVYRTLRKRYWTSDWASMHKFILKHELPDFFEKRLNQGVVAEFLEEHPDLSPPGMNIDSAYQIAVRNK